MNIFIVGFMGSGKSSLGKKIAVRLNRTFIDLDLKIEENEKDTVSGIFKKKGEPYFRALEQQLLLEQSAGLNAVVSLGGGACCNDVSWNFLKQNGIVIYLKEKSDTLFGRLKNRKSERPLLTGLNDTELRGFIEKTLEERSYYYEQADIIYEKENITYSFLIARIQNYLR